MSADNWAVCPRCLRVEHDKREAEAKAVMDSYGKVPVAEFEAARATLKGVNEEDFRTFREDYEVYGAEEGEIRVSYEGRCSACSLSAALETSKRFWSEGSA